MSVQSEITRLENAKSAIKAAIEGKGVTVPSGTLLDGMAALIESIEAGGGGVKIAFGTIVLSEPSSKVEFTHNFGEGANFLTIFTSESSVNSNPGLFLSITSRRRAVVARNNSSGSKNVYVSVGENSGNSNNDKTSIIGNKPINSRSNNIYSDDTKIYIYGYMEEGSLYRLKDGVEYIWLASTWSDD